MFLEGETTPVIRWTARLPELIIRCNSRNPVQSAVIQAIDSNPLVILIILTWSNLLVIWCNPF